MKKKTKKAQARKNSTDIVDLILEDHKYLKQLIETMKDSEADMDDVIDAFDEFAPTLVNHAKPEEQVLYTAMKADEELRTEGFEGEVEHMLADQLVEEIKRTEDEDEWRAKVKVLAELVEHHIEEEEDELLPDFKENSEAEEREEMGDNFLRLKTMMNEKGNDDAPHESMQARH